MALYEHGEMVYATMVSSGLDGWWTQPGVFQVYKRLEDRPDVRGFYCGPIRLLLP